MIGELVQEALAAAPQAENGIGRKVVPHGHHLLRPHVLVVNQLIYEDA